MARRGRPRLYDELKKEIEKRTLTIARASVRKSLKGEVSEIVKSTMKKHIQSDFYNQYSPKVYERRMGFGGLIDDNNIITIVKGLHLTVANITPPSPSIFNTPIRSDDPTLLTTWIDDELIYTEPFSDVATQTLEKHFSRPSFFEKTYDELVGLGVIEKIIRNNLKKDLSKGIKIHNNKVVK